MLSSNFSFAQQISIMTNFPDELNIGEQFKISYSVNSNEENINFQIDSNFELIIGPEISKSTQFKIENGVKHTTYQYQYSYLLEATTEGRIKLPSFSITINDKTYYSDTLFINVLPKIVTNENDSIIHDYYTGEDLFLDMSFSKSDVFIQESFIATLKLYSKNDKVEVKNLALPTYDDFLMYDISSNTNVNTDTINGQIFYSKILQQVLLYPIKSGDFNISGTDIKCSVAIRQDKPKGQKSDVFSDFFGNYTTINRELFLNANHYSIKVKPYPQKQQKNFTGISGYDIKLKDSISSIDVFKNKAFSYYVTISGIGNLNLSSPPSIDLPSDFKIIKYSSYGQLEKNINGIVGSRTFQLNIVPTKAGIFKINSVSLSYFDLDEKKFHKIKTDKKVINVQDNQGEFIGDIDFHKDNKIQSENNCTAIVIDISTSMYAKDLKPNRLDASISEIRKFIEIQEEEVALITFNGISEIKCQPTNNDSLIIDSLNNIYNSKSIDGTAIGTGLIYAISEIKESNAKYKNIILLTDGNNNRGSITPKLAARIANKYGITIYTIGIGTTKGTAPYPVKTKYGERIASIPVDLNESYFKSISDITSGKYFRAYDNNSMDTIFVQIGSILNDNNRPSTYDDFYSKVEVDGVINLIKEDVQDLIENYKKEED